ncbi:MAG: septum formation initiator family protein [Patescibacteria group bacterium]|nr:septum formation initiator family protein [Patescibacteria group bacterium]
MKKSSPIPSDQFHDNSRTWIRFFLFISFLAFVLVTYSLFRETYKKYQIQKEVQDLKNQAAQIEHDNQKLKGLIDYFKTQNFSEKEAREKLNVKKEGESLVILKSQDDNLSGKKNNSNSKLQDPDQESLNIPNPLKWWDYFFKQRLL